MPEGLTLAVRAVAAESRLAFALERRHIVVVWEIDAVSMPRAVVLSRRALIRRVALRFSRGA